jgi:hypothetical protein
LTNHAFIIRKREILKLQGKKGKVPHLHQYGDIIENQPSAKPKRVKFLYENNGPEDYEVITEKSVTRNSSGSLDSLRFVVDEKKKHELPTMVNKSLMREGLPTLSEEEILSRFTKLVAVDTPLLEDTIEIDMIHYKKPIVKIAYELACYWLEESYLDDPTAEILRQFILNPNDSKRSEADFPIKGKIDFMSKPSSLVPFWNHLPDSHIAAINILGGTLCCYVKIFDVFDGCIVVSHHPQLYSDFSASFLEIDARSQKYRESDLISELERLAMNIR